MNGFRLNVGRIKRKSNTSDLIRESNPHILLCRTEASVL